MTLVTWGHLPGVPVSYPLPPSSGLCRESRSRAPAPGAVSLPLAIASHSRCRSVCVDSGPARASPAPACPVVRRGPALPLGSALGASCPRNGLSSSSGTTVPPCRSPGSCHVSKGPGSFYWGRIQNEDPVWWRFGAQRHLLAPETARMWPRRQLPGAPAHLPTGFTGGGPGRGPPVCADLAGHHQQTSPSGPIRPEGRGFAEGKILSSSKAQTRLPGPGRKGSSRVVTCLSAQSALGS